MPCGPDTLCWLGRRRRRIVTAWLPRKGVAMWAGAVIAPRVLGRVNFPDTNRCIEVDLSYL